MTECKHVDCGRVTFQRGLCRTHYEHDRNGELAGQPVVYYVTHAEAPYVKIGFTQYLVSRLSTLSAQLFHAPTLLLAAEPGDRTLERQRQVKFHSARMPGNGELFALSDSLVSHMTEVRQCTGTLETALREATGRGYAPLPATLPRAGHMPRCPCRCPYRG